MVICVSIAPIDHTRVQGASPDTAYDKLKFVLRYDVFHITNLSVSFSFVSFTQLNFLPEKKKNLQNLLYFNFEK